MKKCPHFPRCGGCNRIDTPYERQLEDKSKEIGRRFAGFITGVPPVIPSPEHYFYRHKVQLPFGFSGRGAGAVPTLGCYAADSHLVIDQRECLIQDRDCSAVAWTIREWARRCRLTVYDQKRGRGFLRHVLLRKAAGTGEILVGLVTSGGRPEGSRNLAGALLSMLEKGGFTRSRVVGIVQNVNTRPTNVVLGGEEHVWWGRPFLKEIMGSWRYKIGLSTFFQVNPFQTPRLYDEVLRHVPIDSRVIDCYCGVGSISLWVSRRASEVMGIEENPEAVAAARSAARINRAENVSFVRGDAALRLGRLSREGYTCAIIDPPRKGFAEGMVSAISASAIGRIIYVSCNPVSLLRDLRQLQPDFLLTSLRGFDMFPHTDHVECVAVLDRK